jgi:preprotein translocase subunit YajC
MELLPLLLLLGVMYFLLIRPQKQRVRAQRELVTSLEVGDRVATIGGILGHIVSIDDDEATVETTPGVVIRLRRGAIATRLDSPNVDVTDRALSDDPTVDEG